MAGAVSGDSTQQSSTHFTNIRVFNHAFRGNTTLDIVSIAICGAYLVKYKLKLQYRCENSFGSRNFFNHFCSRL
ncbi:hypothetical protein MPL3356_70346 [Mesorhizobium plurifarium]|uniref:Uncharacterized protein n=1 Tax=Mesorhizobium plurifarium TaxID=69974 RepID=A0A090ECN4_MESPL|nr:hypothetical protein MPL3356_70346 [Mesorhizobium plurifarium]CDX62432.1 hypothetical protein MPL3365_70462 [Mesorhizobium plurifarium]